MYSANNPVNAVDLDGKQMCGIDSYFRYAFSGVNQTSIENKISNGLKKVDNIAKTGVKGTINATDFVSDNSSLFIFAGASLVVSGGIMTSSGVGAAFGVPLMSLGATMVEFGSYVNTASNLTNLGAKVVNLNYNGSMNEVNQQLVNLGTDFTLNKAGSSLFNSKFIINVNNGEVNDAAATTTAAMTSFILNTQVVSSNKFDYKSVYQNRTNASDNTNVNIKYNLIK